MTYVNITQIIKTKEHKKELNSVSEL